MAAAREPWRNITQIRADETIGIVNIQNKTEVPLKSVSCHVTIRGFIADVEAILHYENEARDECEAVFVFPLDPGSVVYSFTMRANDKLLVGECQSKYTAMRRFADAVEGALPVAMLVLDDGDVNVFRCGVGRVPPSTPVIVKLSYCQELDVRVDRGVHYTLPSLMNPAQRPVRTGFQRQWSLMGQSTLARSTLNRSSLRPGTLNPPTRHVPSALDFELEVIGQHKVMAIKTPHDQLTGSFLNQEDTHVKGTLAEPFKFDHELTLGVYYENVEAPCVTAEPAVTLTEESLLDGTVVMINFAPPISDEGPVLGEIKDFVLMIDCSSDKYFERIREGIGYFAKSLPVGSYFNICTYTDNFKFIFPQGSQPYSESTLRQALSLQKSIEPNVGTFPNLHNPISHLFRRFSTPAGSQRQIIVISGGNERFTTAICKIANDNTHNTRIHTIGISPDRSPCIVSELAAAGQGTSHYVHEGACLTSKVMRCMRCAVLPCVRDLDLEWTLPEAVTVTVIPSELPTMLFGERAIIYAVLKGPMPSGLVNKVRISGVNHSMYFSHEVVFCVPEPEIDHHLSGSEEPALPLHRLMARTWMDETYNKCYTDLPGTIAGREANVVSRFTTFVVTDKTDGRQPVPLLEHSSLDNAFLPPNLRTKPRPKPSKVPLKKWLAKAGGAVFKRKSKRKQLPASELTQMVALQRWDGSWELEKSLAELLCVPLKVIRKENPYKVVQEDTSWATALAVVWMEGYHEETVGEWDLLADKATTFLKQRNTDSDELLRRAALLLGLQIEEINDTYW